MIKNLSDAEIFNLISHSLSQKTRYGTYEGKLDILFGASFFDFVFATSDYAKSS
jgi:hypothetical protein